MADYRRMRALVLVGIGAVALLGIGMVAASQLAAPPAAAGTSSSPSSACSPQPCLNLQNYTLWVSNVTQSDGLVRMQVRFRNASDSTHAAPEDLALVSADTQVSPAIQDAPGCTHWDRTEFNNGAGFGPITVCFRPASPRPPWTLRWTPDMGLFCCQADLKVG